MNRSARRFRLAPATALGLLLAASGAHAQDLPSATDVLARYRAAVGGEAAYANRKSMHSTGEFAMPAAGIRADFEGYSVRPNRTAVRISIPGFGEFRTGYTGDVAWAIDPVEGPRLLRGAEAAQLADGAVFESTLRPAALLESATTVERTTIGGRNCLKLKLVWKSGRESFDCFSEETGLLVASQERSETSMGMIDSVALYDDYRDFNGMKIATRTTVQRMGIEQIMTVREVHFDSVPDSALELPAEIKALIGR
jgi:hypothetical protein